MAVGGFLVFAAAVALSCIPEVWGSSEIRGLHPDKKEFYKVGQEFTCLDGSATVPFSLVNDDYCDCRDGSDEPGTSACPNARFYCTNKGYRPHNVLSSRVNDGICDCCDGGDEFDSGVKCPNTCDELGRKAVAEMKRQRELQETGYKKRVEFAEQGAKKRDEFQARLTEKQAELETVKSELERLREAKEAAEEPERAAKDKHREKWEEEKQAKKDAKRRADAKVGFDELDTNSDSFVSLEEIQARIEFDDDADGEVSKEEALEYLDNQQSVDFDTFLERVWSVVADKCRFQSPPEQAKGDEAPQEIPTPPEPERREENEGGDEDEDYDYDDEEEDKDVPSDLDEEMPDYDNATKELIAVADKAREMHRNMEGKKRDLEREVDELNKYLGITFGHNHEFSALYDQCLEYTDREYTYTLCVFGKVTQKPKNGGRETNLGTWGTWSGPSQNPYAGMKYENGEKCWNGPNRSTVVTIKCGLENEVTSASEPNRCEYAMDLSTPALCEPLPHSASHEEL